MSLLYCGIDIGKFSHTGALLSSTLLFKHGNRYEACPTFSFEQSRAGFEKLHALLTEHAPPHCCHVLLEDTGHYGRALEQYLQEKGVTVYRVTVSREKKAKQKSDKRDAQALAVLLYNQVEQHVLLTDRHQQARLLVPPSDTARVLRGLVQHRLELVGESVRRRNKLTAIADQLFPEFANIYADPNSPSALQLREKFPTPRSIATASLDDLCATRKRTLPARAKLADLQELACTTIGTKDSIREECLLLEQKQLIKELRLLQEHIAELDKKIEQAVATSREGQILTSFPMIGPTMAATIIAAIGSIANFPSVAKLRGYCGWSPVETQTGISLDGVALGRSGNRLLKRAIYLITMQAIRMDTAWKALYDRLVPLKCAYDERRGKYRGRMKVIGRVAGQIITVMYVLLKRDHDLIASSMGGELPAPELYQAAKHTIKR